MEELKVENTIKKFSAHEQNLLVQWIIEDTCASHFLGFKGEEINDISHVISLEFQGA